MTEHNRKRRRLADALRPAQQSQQTLDLLFNVDEQGHEYRADLLDMLDRQD